MIISKMIVTRCLASAEDVTVIETDRLAAIQSDGERHAQVAAVSPQRPCLGAIGPHGGVVPYLKSGSLARGGLSWYSGCLSYDSMVKAPSFEVTLKM